MSVLKVVTSIYFFVVGGAYMPLEVSYPPTLLRSVLEDAQPVAVCSKHPFLQRLGNFTIIVDLNSGWLKEYSQLPALVPVQVSLDDMAYTVYSSGTTGKPKGIQCPHRGAVFSYYWRHVAYPYGEDEREACNVFFVWEMLRPLMKGATLYIVPDDVIYDPPRLVDFLSKNRITRMLFTPSLLQAVLEFKGLDLDKAFSSMRQIWFCGEVVTTILRNRVVRLFPHIQLLNLYSISECHDVSCSDLSLDKMSAQPRKFCPAGKLLPGVQIVVMDDEFNIYVGGPALAIGYLNRPELNAQRFIVRPDHVPSSVGDRLYRTGDWGYVLSDGNLEVCGRCDTTVKIRGYTIEIQAVEAALLELPMVNSGCILEKGEEGTDKYLVAYIVPEGKTTQKQIREALKKRLAFYMIPSRFVFIESIPILESSGKLNKKALPDDSEYDIVDPQGLPSTAMEEKVAAIWCRVLNLKNIDVQENFFDLGGHSLLVTQLLNEMNTHFGLQLRSMHLFQYSTVSSMAKYVENPTTNTDTNTLDLVKEVDEHSKSDPISDVSLRAFWRSVELSGSIQQKILLTGATGYLGAFILRELLRKTKAIIFCLVREQPELSAFDRLCQSLNKFGIMSSDILKLMEKRVIALKGDVSLLNLGFTDADYTYLSYEVDSILHVAAFVNLVYPYQALRSSNAVGTENILKFAQENKIKSVHHISTDAVFPEGLHDCAEDTDMTQFSNKLSTGYAQSKWVAEQLILRAQDRGLPVAIYRCGNVGGSSEEASWNPEDFILHMLNGCLYTQSAPKINWQIEFTPVDFVSQLIVKISQKTSHSIGKIFHIINRNRLACNQLWKLLQIQGYKLHEVTYDEWYQKVKSATETNGKLTNTLYLLDALVKKPEFFDGISTFKQINVQTFLEEYELQYPTVDDILMKKYLEMLPEVGLIPQPNSKPRQKCASSGIGEAIAERLALAGANVAVAARRTEKLQNLKLKIEKQGGNVTPVTLDVSDENQGFPGLSVYCGTKFFIEGLSQSLRHEVAEFGVKITCIQPGDVMTELFQNTTDKEAQEKYQMVNKMKVLEPKDVAGAVLYAVTQPDYCAINEILLEPKDAPI
ncbi:hypothetical protein C0J52_05337 [Blattella germanica]|nr:hypothetical protein C0J52_05337 [Blattella germanica]